MEKIEQKKLKVGCNFTDYTSEIAIWVVKFVRIFNLKLLSYFLQLKCCNSFGKGCKTTLMLLFHKFFAMLYNIMVGKKVGTQPFLKTVHINQGCKRGRFF